MPSGTDAKPRRSRVKSLWPFIGKRLGAVQLPMEIRVVGGQALDAGSRDEIGIGGDEGQVGEPSRDREALVTSAVANCTAS